MADILSGPQFIKVEVNKNCDEVSDTNEIICYFLFDKFICYCILCIE